jgi:hypothetical protein
VVVYACLRSVNTKRDFCVAPCRATAIRQIGLLLIWTKHCTTRHCVALCKYPFSYLKNLTRVVAF